MRRRVPWRTPRSGRRTWGLAAGVPATLLLVLTLALASCAGLGGGDGETEDTGVATARTPGSDDTDDSNDSGTDDANADSGSANRERMLKFAECMRDNGVPMEDPEPGGGIRIGGGEGGPVDREKMEAAMEACEEFAPRMGEGPGGGADPEMLENMRKFAQCMRDEGVPEFPDPDGAGIRINEKIAEDPDFEAAQEKCGEKYLPRRDGPRTQTDGA